MSYEGWPAVLDKQPEADANWASRMRVVKGD